MEILICTENVNLVIGTRQIGRFELSQKFYLKIYAYLDSFFFSKKWLFCSYC